MKTQAPTLDAMEGGYTVCPSDHALLLLLGGFQSHSGVNFTHDQYNAICQWAGITKDFNEDDPAKVLWKADATRCVMTEAESQGSRVIAYIAKFLEPGEDPVRWLHGLMMDAGYDVRCWDENEEEND